MQLAHRLRKGKAQARALFPFLRFDVALTENLEDGRDFLIVDPDAGVQHVKRKTAVAFQPDGGIDLTGVGREFDGVGQQVQDDLCHLYVVREQPQIGWADRDTQGLIF